MNNGNANERWVITQTPLRFHESFPIGAKPRLTLFNGVWLWLYWLLLIPAGVVAVGGLFVSTPRGPEWLPSIGLAVGLGVLECAVLLGLILWQRISRGTPKRLVLMALGWGGFVATMAAALVLSPPWLEVTEKLGLGDMKMSVAAALPEELVKGVGVWMMLWIGRSWWNRPWHGLVAGMLVGLGFEVQENVLYSVSLAILNPESDVLGVMTIFGMRVVMGLGLHVLLTGAVGYGIGKAMYEGEHYPRGRRWAVMLGWGLSSTVMHFLWNYTVPAEWSVGMQMVPKVVLWVLLVVTVGVMVYRGNARVRPLMRAGLEPAVTLYRRR